MSNQSPRSARRRFIRTTTGGTILAALPLAGCGAFAGVPESAIQAWRPTTDRGDPRRWALSHAILAPNPHNRQPWLVDLRRTGEIELRIDTTRLLPETDPYGRQILIGAGAMLGLFQLAAARIGYRSEIRLFDEGAFGEYLDSRPLARIRLVPDPGSPAAGDDAALFDRIPHRRTVRLKYDPARAPDARFAGDLARDADAAAMAMATTSAAGVAARADGSLRIGVIARSDDPGRADAIARLAKDAWKVELTTPRCLMESIRLLRVGSAEIDRFRDGLTSDSAMLVVLDRLGLFDRRTPPPEDSSILKRQVADFDAAIDSTPAYFWLSTAGNSRREQIEAGVAYARAQLRASAHGMVMHPASQALQEYPEMAALRRRLPALIGTAAGANAADGGPTVQMLCRIGYLPAGVAMPGPSPRRGLDAHLAA